VVLTEESSKVQLNKIVIKVIIKCVWLNLSYCKSYVIRRQTKVLL